MPVSGFLTHSIATALIAQRIAKKFLNVKDASDYFVAGLVHDFGKAVLIQYEPKTYSAVLRQAREKQCALAEVELEKFSVTNGEVGAMLAESWDLPVLLVDSIRTYISRSTGE